MNPSLKKVLLILCSFQIIALTACNLPLSNTPFELPIEQELREEAELESVRATHDFLCAALTDEECDDLMRERSEPTADASEQALATARVEATATRAYFETQEALCVNLTREECASLGGHSYNVLAVGRDTGKCTYYDRPTEVWRGITFENGKFKLEGYTSDDYDGHTRIAENTYKWVNPTGSTETVTFTMNGQIVVVASGSGECITDITYTFKE